MSTVSLTFPATLFDSDTFTEEGNDSVTVYRVNHDRDPLQSLRNCPQHPSATKCQVLGPLLARYSSHLDDDARNVAQAWEAARSDR